MDFQEPSASVGGFIFQLSIVRVLVRLIDEQAVGKSGLPGFQLRGEMTVTTPSKPTYEQAQLHLQVYDLRREAKLRQARDWFFKNYFATNLDEGMKITAPMTEGGAYFMQVVSYWENACALLNYGLLHEDLFFSTSGEFYGVWERIKPVVDEGRKKFVNQLFAANLEEAAKKYESWIEKRSPGHIAAMREFSKQIQAQVKSAKAA